MMVKKYVAVYGTLMEGQINAHWREDIETVTTGSMFGWLYDTGYGFPAFVPSDEDEVLKAGMVHCEILEVNDEQIAHMDVLEGYPLLYRHEKVTVHGMDDNDYDCLVYVMNKMPVYAKLIVSGDWGEYCNMRNCMNETEVK